MNAGMDPEREAAADQELTREREPVRRPRVKARVAKKKAGRPRRRRGRMEFPRYSRVSR